jgi:ABC-type bacteriocin/lantibiotic exporter with double-glycine peptidase domain
MSPSAGAEVTPSLREAVRQFRRLLSLIRPYWSPLMQGLALALILGVVAMIPPLLTKVLIDEVYPAQDVTLMQVVVGGVLALALASTVLGALRSYFSLHVYTRLSSATRLMFFNHLQHLRARFFDHHQVGEINSRFQDVGRALDSISMVFQTLFVQGIFLLLVPPVLFWLEWRLALVAILSLPLTFSLTLFSGPILRRSWKRSSEAFAELAAYQIEALSHIRTLKTMGLEKRVYQRARGLLENAMEQQLKAGGLAQGFGAANGVLYAVNSALFTWFGWRLILGRQMTLGEFLAFAAYITYLYNPINQLIQLFSDFQQSAIHLSRMFEYLDEPVEQEPSWVYEEEEAPVRPLSGSLRLEQVSFAYTPQVPVLTGVSVEFPWASITAIVGPSGSGKTSLLRLLARLEEPTDGRILLGGAALHELPLRDLRQQISVVWQEVSLVRGTLLENLVLAGSTPQPQELAAILEICGLSSLVRSLPAGLATPVSEWGASLSAGQRQRVALARALVRGAPLLLLDEATANVDVETEQEILRRVFADRSRTVVFVTHRLATAILADQVVVLEEGHLQGAGRHEDLLQSCPAYRRMHGLAPRPDAEGSAVQGVPG